MGTLSLDDMKGEIRASLGNRTDLDDRLSRVINLSQMRIARKHRWEELEELYKRNLSVTSSAYDDKFITFPNNLRDVYSAKIRDGFQSRKLTRVPYRRWDRVIPAPEEFSRGHPSHYTLFRNVMELWRVPDSTYEILIRAVAWPTTLANPTDTTDLDRKDDLLITLSVSWLLLTLGREEEANKWWRIYRNMMNDAGAEENERPDLDILPGPGSNAKESSGPYYSDPFQSSMPD